MDVELSIVNEGNTIMFEEFVTFVRERQERLELCLRCRFLLMLGRSRSTIGGRALEDGLAM